MKSDDKIPQASNLATITGAKFVKKTLLVASVIIVGTTFGRADAQSYNGPLTPNPYTGYSVYYFYGSYSDLSSALNTTNALTGVPDGYKFLPWWGKSTSASNHAYAWSQGTSFGDSGVKYPINGTNTPTFAYFTNIQFDIVFVNSVSSNGSEPTYTQMQDSEANYYAVAVSQ